MSDGPNAARAALSWESVRPAPPLATALPRASPPDQRERVIDERIRRVRLSARHAPRQGRRAPARRCRRPWWPTTRWTIFRRGRRRAQRHRFRCRARQQRAHRRKRMRVDGRQRQQGAQTLERKAIVAKRAFDVFSDAPRAARSARRRARAPPPDSHRRQRSHRAARRCLPRTFANERDHNASVISRRGPAAATGVRRVAGVLRRRSASVSVIR